MADKKGILYNEAAKAYFYGDCVSSIEPYGGGHINDTFLAHGKRQLCFAARERVCVPTPG